MAPARSTGPLFIVSGPSGAGKGTLVARALARVEGAWLSVSATTRAPRSGERDGVDYRFMSVHEFEETIRSHGFIEWAQVHGNYYGTLRAPIEQHRAAGFTVLLEIDVQGAFQVREQLPDAMLVFIAPPSIEELERRLRGRATDAEEVIARRLENAAGEMEASARYDTVIVNDDLEKATDELVEVLES